MKKGDKAQFELIRKDVSVWNKWRANDPDAAINLRYGDFSRHNLKRANLRKADLFRACCDHATLDKADFQNADLRKTSFRFSSLESANFEKADMRGADLQGADLSAANFSGTNLQKANLKDAVLNMAVLEGANLKEAICSNTWMRGTILRHSNMSGARLHRVKMHRVDLKRTNFKNAHCFQCLFCDLDLGEAKGLQDIHHEGPSSIAIDTIYNSRGKLPETFLRGAGVPECMVSLFSKAMIQGPNYHSCFIIYSHADQTFAKYLYRELQRRNIRCWLHEYNVFSCDALQDNANRCIRAWDRVLLCCSKNSLTSWWIKKEIDDALKKEQALMNHKKQRLNTLIPLNLDNYLFSTNLGKAYREPILSRLAANFKGWETDSGVLAGQIENVVNALKLK